MADTGEGTNKPKKGSGSSGRMVRIVLVLSLALNAFVIALVAGAAMKHQGWGGHPAVRDVGFGVFSEILSREDRRALRAAFRAEAPHVRDGHEVAREEFREMAAALRADPWDRARIETLIAGHTARIAERIDVGRRLLLQRMEDMSAAERAALADRIDEVLARGWRR